MTAPNTTCSNGLAGLENNGGTVCCVSGCDPCGGAGCATNTTGLSAGDCCAGPISDNGLLCSDTNSAPCVLDPAPAEDTSNTTCSDGLIVGIENSASTVCCDSGCGQCGGSGCRNITGLSADDCCTSEIEKNGQLCSVVLSAPCVLDVSEVVPSTCSNGLAGVESESGTICCAEACDGQCGGAGCGSIAGTNEPSDCCAETIRESGVSCEDSDEAPCIIVNGTSVDGPTASPVDGPTFSPTAGSRNFGGGSLSPTSAPNAGSREFGGGSLSPTSAPNAGSRGDQFSGAPTVFDPTTPFPTTGGGVSPGSTTFPDVTLAPTSGASAASAGVVVSLAAMAGGLFAVFAAARK